jgi:hypothetical protein
MRRDWPERPIRVGDPMPWFSARTVTGNAFELQVSAGRWVVLLALGSLEAPGARDELAALLAQAARLHEDRLVVQVVLREVPHDVAPLAALSTPALGFLADPDGAIS